MRAGLLAAFSGMAAPMVYGLAVVLGGALDPHYSHLNDTVSSLASSGAPNRALMNMLFALYNLLLLGFGAGWWVQLRGGAPAIAPLGIAAAGLIGSFIQFFPQDPMGSALTPAGWMHIVLVAGVTLSMAITIVAHGLSERWRGLRQRSAYSFLTIAALFGSGLLSAYGASHGWPMVGLLERVTVATMMVWVFVEALLLWRDLTTSKTAETLK